MNIPNIDTPNNSIKLFDDTHALLLCDYYQKNKDYLQVWEPTRSSEFYTIEYWQNQALSAEQLFQDKQAVKLIALNKTQTKVIATCNFSNIVWGCFYACHLGFSIDKHHQGKGIMYDIIDAGINYMKQEFKLHRIMANHLPHNYRSAKLLKKLGFEKEGYAKSYLKINGKWQDHVLNSLILPSK